MKSLRSSVTDRSSKKELLVEVNEQDVERCPVCATDRGKSAQKHSPGWVRLIGRVNTKSAKWEWPQRVVPTALLPKSKKTKFEY